MSIGMLVTDTSLDFSERKRLAMKAVYGIIMEEDLQVMLLRYWSTGDWLLRLYSGAAVTHHGRLRPAAESGWSDDELDARLMSTPDPDFPGSTFLLCQAVLYDREQDESEVYVSEFGSRSADATEALLASFEAFAKECKEPVRGVLLLMESDGGWRSIYFDGKRWINVLYLEWQTAANLVD